MIGAFFMPGEMFIEFPGFSFAHFGRWGTVASRIKGITIEIGGDTTGLRN